VLHCRSAPAGKHGVRGELLTLNFITKTLQYRNKEVAWQKKYDAFAPKEGALAPDFELFDVSGKHRVRLSEFRGQKHVALVFGSFT